MNRHRHRFPAQHQLRDPRESRPREQHRRHRSERSGTGIDTPSRATQGQQQKDEPGRTGNAMGDTGGKRRPRPTIGRTQMPKRQHGPGGNRERQNPDRYRNQTDLRDDTKTAQALDITGGIARLKQHRLVVLSDRWRP
jgi:hypothetical protein